MTRSTSIPCTLAVILVGCGGGGGGGTTTPLDAPPFVTDAGTIITGSPITPGDTITANADRVELSVSPVGGALAAWRDTGTHVAHGAVFDGGGRVLGHPFAISAVADVTAVHALTLAGPKLALGIESAGGGYLVATVDPDTTMPAAPVTLATPASASCQFAPPDRIVCATATAGMFELGTIDPDTATVAFGAPHPLAAAPIAARSSGGGTLAFTDANGCGWIAGITGANDLGDAHALPCTTTGPSTTLATAIAPQPTSDGTFGRAFVSVATTDPHRQCAFYAFGASLADATTTASATDAQCPRAVSWGQGLLFGIQIEANGTSTMVTYSADGQPNQFPNPILGIGNIKAADIISGTIGLATMAILDGQRVQFAVFNGEPI